MALEPSFFELSAAAHLEIVCSSKWRCRLNTTRNFSSADATLQDTGAIAPAEYGRVAVRAHFPLISGQGAASTADGVSSTSTVDSFFFCFASVRHVYPAFVLHPRFP